MIGPLQSVAPIGSYLIFSDLTVMTTDLITLIMMQRMKNERRSGVLATRLTMFFRFDYLRLRLFLGLTSIRFVRLACLVFAIFGGVIGRI